MKSYLHYQDGSLFIENAPLAKIAEEFGTPCYVYSKKALETNWHTFDNAFSAVKHRICYAVKANSNLAILNLFAQLQSGFDIVSQGELERVLKAGGDPKKIVFSGVGKNAHEIERAIEAGIYCFNVESEPELERINAIANKLNQTVNIAFRINPNINPHTHAHVVTGLAESKFGINIEDILPLSQQVLPNLPALKLIGIGSHIGSQILQLEPFLLVIDRLLETYKALQKVGIELKHINIGGGLGIIYHDEHPPGILDYADALQEKLANYPLEVFMEPGRAIVGNAGVLLSRIEYIKHHGDKHFAILDAGMNDFIRPALYDAWQTILPVIQRDTAQINYEIAGPVCESADFLGKNRELAIRPYDLLVVDATGAYGFSMSSNYNSRCRPAEILVDDQDCYLIRKRETIEHLYAGEKIPNLQPA